MLSEGSKGDLKLLLGSLYPDCTVDGHIHDHILLTSTETDDSFYLYDSHGAGTDNHNYGSGRVVQNDDHSNSDDSLTIIYANGIKYMGKVQYEEGDDWKTSIPHGKGQVIVDEGNELTMDFENLQIKEEHPKYSSGWSNDNHHHIRIYNDGRIYFHSY